MKLSKSPGLDGLTVELYLAFWDKTKCFLSWRFQWKPRWKASHIFSEDECSDFNV
jgi:hypothetical protein